MSIAESESESGSASATGSHSTLRCAECESRLAHDQRYCVDCGARRGPLPAQVAKVIGALREQGPAASLPPEAALAGSVVGGRSRSERFEFEMPGPRATAVAVMAMLAFGLIVGSLVGGAPVETLANAPLIVVGLTHPATSAPSAPAVSGEAGSGGADSAAAAPAPAPAATSPAPDQAAVSPSTSPVPSTGTNPSSSGGFNGLPPVKHLFLIVLSDRGFTQSFGGHGGYLSGALRRQGELVQNYYAVAGAPLANEIAMISGQGPTPQTAGDCPVFSRVRPARKGPRGQVLGTGCDYPAAVKTLAAQLASGGRTWKAYVGGIDNDARGACRVPKLGSQPPQTLGHGTSYLAWRNPFLYFRSLTAGTACRQNEVAIGRLAKDVKSTTTAPSFAYIIPPPCATGGEAPCKRGAPTSLAAADRFLKSVVPEIKRSAAYKDGGLIAITFDQAPQTGAHADPSACCGPASYPNLSRLATPPAVPPAAMGAGTTTTGTDTTAGTTGTDTTTTGTDATTPGTTGTDTTMPTTTPTTPTSLGAGATTATGGGGQVGLLLISPYVKPNSIDVTDYFNHFSLLASVENLFGLHHLGYAGVPALPTFGVAVFNNYAG